MSAELPYQSYPLSYTQWKEQARAVQGANEDDD